MKLYREILFPLIAVVVAFVIGGIVVLLMATVQFRPTAC